LNQSGFENDVIGAVLADLERADLVNDEEFARIWVASRVSSGAAGRHKLRWELRRKGIHEDLIRRAVDEAVNDETEVEQALGLARRRLRGQPAEGPELLRLRRLLLSRGYGFSTVETAMRRLSSQVEDLGD
jgi:regulatory protein